MFPRPHVGESLVPATTPVLLEIGALDEVEAAGFPKKYGAAWTSAETRDIDHIGFERPDRRLGPPRSLFIERDQPGVDRDYTYHVDRGKFDQILLQHAKSLGARSSRARASRGVDFSDPDRPIIRLAIGKQEVGVTVQHGGRRQRPAHPARPASSSCKVPDPVFDQYAVHTWFEGFDRDALGDDPGPGRLHLHPLPADQRHLGLADPDHRHASPASASSPRSRTSADAKDDREKFFWDSVGQPPELARRAQATPSRSAPQGRGRLQLLA